MTAEHERLRQSQQGQADWKHWGPYVSERAWGTVREDYSPDGSAWKYLPHDHARSKAYRWGEDGLAGICDRHQHICFALALWNGHDPILKERLFGVSGPEGNHGADVKEYYYYLDNTPTHSYMKYLYKYPQAEYPYIDLVEKSKRRGSIRPEYELIDTGIFDEDRYFDVFVEYAKASPEDILVRITVINRGPETAMLDLLPTLWFRNTWTWGSGSPRPLLSRYEHYSLPQTYSVVNVLHDYYGQRWLYCEETSDLLFSENETSTERLYGVQSASPYVKDSINDYIIQGKRDAVNPEKVGTKMSAHYHLTLKPGETHTVQLLFSDSGPEGLLPFGEAFEETFKLRTQEANEFYAAITPPSLSEDGANIRRQAFAGMLWNKQYYYFDVQTWLQGDHGQPQPPQERLLGRNHDWTHLNAEDIISMPDKWEYPAFDSWSLAFHCIVLALIDPDFAKEQVSLMFRERYMHPNGRLPAHEWAFSDINPPVQSWAAYQVYKIEQKQTGKGDLVFLESMLQGLILNFTWWINRQDYNDENLFQGGSLGLDNISVFDRNIPLPDGSYLRQSDGTSWMCMFCLNMMRMAMELATINDVYVDVASKFFEHFMYIADAINSTAGDDAGLWNEEDKFFYDCLSTQDGRNFPLKLRTLVGFIPLLAVETFEREKLDALPGLNDRLQWFIENRPQVSRLIAIWEDVMGDEEQPYYMLALVRGSRLKSLLKVMLDESEFLSPYGLRSLSRYHLTHPYLLVMDGVGYRVDYRPGETSSGRYGGNTNWRGPIWFSLNYLLIEALQKFHSFYGDEFKVECPTGSRNLLSLGEVAAELSRRLASIFLRDEHGLRAVYGGGKFQHDPHWRDYLLFYEYFHCDTGAGIGASHCTGGTGLVVQFLEQSGQSRVPMSMHLEVEEHPHRDEDLSKVDYSHADLSGADLREIDLREANLRGADLSEADLRESDLYGADLSEAWLFKTLLFKTNLSDANLSKAHLRRADLNNANLSRADLSVADLREANFSRANLSGADLHESDLSNANFREADLRGADLQGTNWSGIDLRRIALNGTNFNGINLNQVDQRGVDLSEANLSGANLSRAILIGAVLHKVIFTDAVLARADLSGANLSEADLRGADLRDANLYGALLCKADLSGADLSGANFSEANLSEANLTGCRIYAISAWNIRMEKTTQTGLIITPYNEPTITVDNLRVAQFIYLLLNNQEIRDVINTITSKVVLILGRFTPPRKAILDALKDELHQWDYVPVLFDFDKPESRDITETITTLARMARFIIADLTEPQSIPQELAFIVPFLPSVPIQPLLQGSQREYGMFEHFTKYPWVLPTHRYTDQANLLQSLKEQIIDPAERKAKELTKR